MSIIEDMSMSKISIIGTGNLGSCIAYTLAERRLCNELVLIDAIRELAEGNALDITQAIAAKNDIRNDIRIQACEYKDIEGSDIIVVAAGKARSTEMKSRLELMSFNAGIIREIAEHIKQYAPKSIIITVTNPVDVMNYMMYRSTGFDRSRIIGSGQELDSVRFRLIAARGRASDVEGYVMGEHGDSQVPVFSKLKQKGKYMILPQEEKEEVIEKCRNSSTEVINRKGATVYGPANNTVNMIEAIIKDQRKLMMCSAVLDGEYGHAGLSIGVPAILGKKGIIKIEEWQLINDEQKMFIDSVLKLKGYIREMYR